MNADYGVIERFQSASPGYNTPTGKINGLTTTSSPGSVPWTNKENLIADTLSVVASGGRADLTIVGSTDTAQANTDNLALARDRANLVAGQVASRLGQSSLCPPSGAVCITAVGVPYDGRKATASAQFWTASAAPVVAPLFDPDPPPTPSSYTVTFDANGGSGSMAAQTASSPTNLTANAFTLEGYTFNGWNTDENGSGVSYANSASYPFTSSVTLYAQWTANSYTVTYNGNSNTGGAAPANGSATFGSSFTVATNSGTLTRTGYTFNGWNTEADGLGTSFTAGGTVTWSRASATTLFAQWRAIEPPSISTSSTVSHRQVNPTLVVTTSTPGYAFKGSLSLTDLQVSTGSTTLNPSSVTRNSAGQFTILFTGTARPGTITVQVRTSASSPAAVAASNTVAVTVVRSTVTVLPT